MPRLVERLVDDAAMFPPGNAPVEVAVADHQAARGAWFAPVVGPLVVRDATLAAVGAAARRVQDAPVEVSVVASTGAGGLLATASRDVAGVAVVAVEVALRDLTDLVGNVRRVAAAATELDPEVRVFVELPTVRGWEDAAAVVEEAGLLGKIRTGGVEPADFPSRTRLVEQLSVLVEADLAFKATAGLHHALPTTGRNARGDALPQHGFLTLMIALAALIDGADRGDAANILGWSDAERVARTVAGWDGATVDGVRRRFRSFGCCGVHDPVADLQALGLLAAA